MLNLSIYLIAGVQWAKLSSNQEHISYQEFNYFLQRKIGRWLDANGKVVSLKFINLCSSMNKDCCFLHGLVVTVSDFQSSDLSGMGSNPGKSIK